MKRWTILCIGILGLYLSAASQSEEIKDRIESRKIALITKELDLSPEQAEKFWPIYREYDQRRSSIHKEFADQRRNFNAKTATDEETRKMIDFGLKVKERQLNLEREYSDRMRKVLTDRQLLNLRRTEEEFKQMLLERVRQRRQQVERNRQQNDNLKNRRRNN